MLSPECRLPEHTSGIEPQSTLQRNNTATLYANLHRKFCPEGFNAGMLLSLDSLYSKFQYWLYLKVTKLTFNPWMALLVDNVTDSTNSLNEYETRDSSSSALMLESFDIQLASNW